jgi:hypothetical protein
MIVEQILNGPRFSPDLLHKRLEEIEQYAKDAAHSPKVSNEIQSDASEVVMDIQGIRQCLLRNEPERAIWKAINLGQDFERLRIRVSGAESLAVTGRKTRKNAKNHNANLHSDAIKDYKLFTDMVEEQVKIRGGEIPSLTDIRHYIRDELGWKESKMDRAVKWAKKQSKK